MLFGFIKKYGSKKILLAACDLFCTLLASLLSIVLTNNGSMKSAGFSGLLIEKITIFLIASLLIIPIFRYYHLYKHKYFLRVGEQILLILKGLLIDCVIVILIIFIVKTQEALHDSRLQVIYFFSFSFILISLYRVILFRPAVQSRNLNENIHRFITRRALAIGAGGLGRFFLESLSMKQYYHIDLIGYVDDDPLKQNSEVLGVAILGGTKDLNSIVAEHDIDEIYITIQKISNKELLDLIEKCKLTPCQINLVSNHFDIINAKLDVNEFHDLKIISISSKASPLYSEKFKRIFDVFISSALISIIMIPSLIVSLLIKLTSSGSVFYKSKVIGKDGKPFFWYKFRTMYTNNDPTIHKEHLKKLIVENHANQKLINDLRITKVGKILRKFSLDELPQLISVFKGDMSLVGPRPCLVYEYEIFKDWHKLKYKVIPGMTGLAQIIARNRKDVTFNDSVLLDLYYADNQSLWLDLRILFKTVPILMFGKGGV